MIRSCLSDPKRANTRTSGDIMNQQEIADLSADIIMRYYDNDVTPFLSSMDEDALWYGPAEGQFIRGRAKMFEAWGREEHDLTFTMGNLVVTHISGHPSTCEVMLAYTLVTHYPDGHELSVFQRLQLSWCMRLVFDAQGNRSRVPRILVCHISNPHAKHADDEIYGVHFHHIYAGGVIMPHKSERIHLHGADKSDCFFLSDSIQWAESARGGKHSVVHTPGEAVEVRAPIAALARSYGHLFLRCHASYLVNPHYVRSVRRFRVTMTDGTELPIPERKYTAFRKQLDERLCT